MREIFISAPKQKKKKATQASCERLFKACSSPQLCCLNAGAETHAPNVTWWVFSCVAALRCRPRAGVMAPLCRQRAPQTGPQDDGCVFFSFFGACVCECVCVCVCVCFLSPPQLRLLSSAACRLEQNMEKVQSLRACLLVMSLALRVRVRVRVRGENKALIPDAVIRVRLRLRSLIISCSLFPLCHVVSK